MAQFVNREKLLSDNALDQFKYEIAEDMGLQGIQDGYWGEVSARDCGHVGGKIGGRMVRVLIRRAEEALARGERI